MVVGTKVVGVIANTEKYLCHESAKIEIKKDRKITNYCCFHVSSQITEVSSTSPSDEGLSLI